MVRKLVRFIVWESASPYEDKGSEFKKFDAAVQFAKKSELRHFIHDRLEHKFYKRNEESGEYVEYKPET